MSREEGEKPWTRNVTRELGTPGAVDSAGTDAPNGTGIPGEVLASRGVEQELSGEDPWRDTQPQEGTLVRVAPNQMVDEGKPEGAGPDGPKHEPGARNPMSSLLRVPIKTLKRQ